MGSEGIFMPQQCSLSIENHCGIKQDGLQNEGLRRPCLACLPITSSSPFTQPAAVSSGPRNTKCVMDPEQYNRYSRLGCNPIL
jgi:hypothetical protein